MYDVSYNSFVLQAHGCFYPDKVPEGVPRTSGSGRLGREEGTHSAKCGTCVLDPGLFPGINYFSRALSIQVFTEQETGKKSWPQPSVTYKHTGLHLEPPHMSALDGVLSRAHRARAELSCTWLTGRGSLCLPVGRV